MPDFEKGNYSKEAYDQTAESEASLRAQLATAKPEDIIAIGTRLQALEAKKNEMKEEAHGEANEANKVFDETKAFKEKARIEEQARVQAEEDAAKLAEARAKIHGEGAEETKNEIVESEQIDPIALNNRIVRIDDDKAKKEALDNLSQAEIAAIAHFAANAKSSEDMLGVLRRFNYKSEIISQPETIQAIKDSISKGMHAYDIERVLDIPGFSNEIFDDPAVQKGVQESLGDFISRKSHDESNVWKYISGTVDKIVKEARISNQGIQNIAEMIKVTDSYQPFAQHFEGRINPNYFRS